MTSSNLIRHHISYGVYHCNYVFQYSAISGTGQQNIAKVYARCSGVTVGILKITIQLSAGVLAQTKSQHGILLLSNFRHFIS